MFFRGNSGKEDILLRYVFEAAVLEEKKEPSQ